MIIVTSRSTSGVNGSSINECGIKSKVLKNVYCNIPKIYDSLNFAVNMPKIEPKVFFYRIIPNKEIDRIANSEDPD